MESGEQNYFTVEPVDPVNNGPGKSDRINGMGWPYSGPLFGPEKSGVISSHQSYK